MDEDVETPPLSLRVVGGGEPSPEELAAILVALTPTASDAGAGDGQGPRAGWRLAAMIEGVGGRPAASPADLDRSRLRA